MKSENEIPEIDEKNLESEEQQEVGEVEEEKVEPQYYADFDESGNIAGFYLNEIHGDNIPETAIPISETDWQTYSSAAHQYKLEGEVIREKNQQELDDEAAARPPAPKTPLQELQDENKELRQAIAELTVIMTTMGGA